MQHTPPTSRAFALFAALLVLAALAAGMMASGASASSPVAVAPEPGPATGVAVLAYAQNGRVWWISTAGQPRELPAEGYVAEAALAPDGRQLAYLLIPASALGQAPLPAQLWLADLSDGAMQPLAEDLVLRGQLAWSPDATRLAVAEQRQLAVYDLASGARRVVAQELAMDGPSYAGYAWLPDGSGLACLTQDDAERQWVTLTAGGDGSRSAVATLALPGGERATAVAPSSDGQAVTLLLESGTLAELWLDGGSLAPLTSAGERVTAFAWSSDGARLAYASPNGLLWLAVRGASGLAPQPLASLAAPVARLTWNAAGQIEITLATRGGQAAALVTPDPAGVSAADVRTAGLSPLADAQAAPPELPLLADVGAPFAWYRFQGDYDSGSCASYNCGPTSVAMAIQFARDGLYVPISEIRTQMSGAACAGTNSVQVRGALSAWSVPYQNINGLSAVRDAVNLRGHIVLVPVIMGDIAPGVDYEVWNSNPANVYGRYYSYALGHWLVVRGISADGQWVKVYDPNVWYSGKYHYSDGAPKGRDRLYRYSEFATAFANNGNWAIEVMAVPTATPPGGAPQPPTNVQASNGAYADRVAITWTAPTGATFYSVHRSDTPAGAKQLLGLPAQASWDDATIAPGVTAYYWVTACNTDGCSDYAGPAAGSRASAPLDLPPRAWMPIVIAGW